MRGESGCGQSSGQANQASQPAASAHLFFISARKWAVLFSRIRLRAGKVLGGDFSGEDEVFLLLLSEVRNKGLSSM